MRFFLPTALLSAAGTAVLLAGPLDPPAGPIAPTYKTLSEVEPRIAINAANTPCALNGLSTGDGAGIHTTGADNRVEGNNCTGADRGIDADAAGNIIVGNTCSGNTVNWAIVANNIYGPIIDRTAPASAAVNGNAAASTLGSTDPNANFSY